MYLSRLKQSVRNSLRLKLALLLSVVTAVLTLTFTSYYIFNERSAYRSRLKDKGNLLATILASSLQIPLYADNSEDVAFHVTQILANGDISAIKVFSNTGELLAFAGADDRQSENSRLTIRKAVTSQSR